jgi:hypothetical protein
MRSCLGSAFDAMFTRNQRDDYACGASLEAPPDRGVRRMKRTRLLMMSIALLAALFSLSACKQNQPNNTPPPLLSIAG